MLTSFFVGSSGALVESMPCYRRVAGSNPALVDMYTDIGQVLHLQFTVALRRVNSDTVSISVVGSAYRVDINLADSYGSTWIIRTGYLLLGYALLPV